MRFFVVIIASLFVLFSTFGSAFAFVPIPFGGRIAVYPVPGVTCPGNTSGGQLTIVPYTISPFGPYTPIIENPLFKIRPGSLIKGTYSPTPVPICFTTTIVPVPVPTLPIINYGITQLPL